MKGQLGFATFFMILPVILLVILIITSTVVVDALKLPLIALASILVYSMIYNVFSSITRNKNIKIIGSIIFSVIVAYAMYTSWTRLIVGLAILIPTYGIMKEMFGSPIKAVTHSMSYGMYRVKHYE